MWVRPRSPAPVDGREVGVVLVVRVVGVLVGGSCCVDICSGMTSRVLAAPSGRSPTNSSMPLRRASFVNFGPKTFCTRPSHPLTPLRFGKIFGPSVS